MTDWRWVAAATVSAIHSEQLAAWGGGTGIRDDGLLDSALARPMNLVAYGQPDAAALAAAYAFGLCRNHPFIDGNKRAAWVTARLFLAKNGVALRYTDADATVRMLALAAGEIGEEQFANWIRERIMDAP